MNPGGQMKAEDAKGKQKNEQAVDRLLNIASKAKWGTIWGPQGFSGDAPIA